jgi:hypothetical protein
MTESSTAVRQQIRARVVEVLTDRAGDYLTTQDLLHLIDEAETSSVLAGLCADLVKSGRIERGPRALNYEGRAVNTWGVKAKSKTRGKGKDKPERPVQPPADDPYLSEAIRAETARAEARASQDVPARAIPLPSVSMEDEPISAVPSADLAADALVKMPSTGTMPRESPQATPPPTAPISSSVTISRLPSRWFPELRLILTTEDSSLPAITLRAQTEGLGPFWSIKMGHDTWLDEDDADFLPIIGRELCAVINALWPTTWTDPPGADPSITPSQEHTHA